MDDGRFKKTFLDIPKVKDIWDIAPFPPCFMDSRDKRVHEVWFPGIHEDVGGSMKDHGLSDCSGVYMQEWLANEGIAFYDTAEEIPKENFIIPGNPQDIYPVVPAFITMKPDPSARDWHNDGKLRDDPRPVITVHNNKKYKGTIRIHETVLEHLKRNKDYTMNAEVKKTDQYEDLVVVGSLDKVDDEKTNEFKYYLEI
mmetsp:Transcript_18702/g.38351  ORF Transcript_18702/g.38351 Transcript_18702/m.38351 type:complete len:198 (+) Transcript_18702:467-1060(+)